MLSRKNYFETLCKAAEKGDTLVTILCYIEYTVDFKKHPYAVQVVYTEYKTREDKEGNWF